MVTGRVLIVDDDPYIREMLVDFLNEEGFEVFSAVNGQEAVVCAMKELPECILMDLNMPVLDGLAAIHRLKSDDTTRNIRIIAMSARSVIDAKQGDLVADGTLGKPFDLGRVLELARGEPGRVHRGE